MKDEIKAKDTKIGELEQKNTASDNTIKNLKDEIKDKDKKIAELEQRPMTNNPPITNTQNNEDEIKVRDMKIRDLEKKLQTYASMHEGKREETDNQNLLMQIQQKDNLLRQREIELEKLRKEISQLGNVNLTRTQIFEDEKIALIILSQDSQIWTSYSCNINEPFVRVEEKLYNDYPAYKQKENYFLANGTKIWRFLTLKENKLTKDGTKVTLITCEFN